MKVGQHKVQSNMDLLGWKEITTSRQQKMVREYFNYQSKSMVSLLRWVHSNQVM